MKIKVEFTVDVPRDELEALRELASANTNAQAADFVRLDAIEYVHGYLGSNGVNNIRITEPWERNR